MKQDIRDQRLLKIKRFTDSNRIIEVLVTCNFMFSKKQVEVRLQDLTEKTSAVLALAPVVKEIEEKPAKAAAEHEESE